MLQKSLRLATQGCRVGGIKAMTRAWLAEPWRVGGGQTSRLSAEDPAQSAAQNAGAVADVEFAAR